MKKNAVKKLKKLQLSRETLNVLASSDARKVVGGTVIAVVGCSAILSAPGGTCDQTNNC